MLKKKVTRKILLIGSTNHGKLHFQHYSLSIQILSELFTIYFHCHISTTLISLAFLTMFSCWKVVMPLRGLIHFLYKRRCQMWWYMMVFQNLAVCSVILYWGESFVEKTTLSNVFDIKISVVWIAQIQMSLMILNMSFKFWYCSNLRIPSSSLYHQVLSPSMFLRGNTNSN